MSVSGALERRKNEQELHLPAVTLTVDEKKWCEQKAQSFVDHPASQADRDVVEKQLGRFPRGMIAVAARCHVCSTPLVVVTRPLIREKVRHPTPFPTTFYLTSPEATKAVSRLEATGVMARFTQRLENAGHNPDTASQEDQNLLRALLRAHLLYCEVSADIADLLGDDITHIRSVGVGGMPTRVKCLHAMVGQALALGSHINPIGDWALEQISDEFSMTTCRCVLRV